MARQTLHRCQVRPGRAEALQEGLQPVFVGAVSAAPLGGEQHGLCAFQLRLKLGEPRCAARQVLLQQARPGRQQRRAPVRPLLQLFSRRLALRHRLVEPARELRPGLRLCAQLLARPLEVLAQLLQRVQLLGLQPSLRLRLLPLLRAPLLLLLVEALEVRVLDAQRRREGDARQRRLQLKVQRQRGVEGRRTERVESQLRQVRAPVRAESGQVLCAASGGRRDDLRGAGPGRCRLPARRDVGLQPHADLKATGRRRHVLVARVAQPQREAAVDHRPGQVVALQLRARARLRLCVDGELRRRPRLNDDREELPLKARLALQAEPAQRFHNPRPLLREDADDGVGAGGH
mmetsp:Transcript_41649/g.131556  ORF Transcript_41649/g.131556 Transcript_41649/m.131556 type:complete len:347 (+) Transcript_41649:886-1926(+)